MTNPKKFIISGGGSGGHIFPAIAIANALKQEFDSCEILFIGAQDKMEMEKVPAAGFAIEGLWISGFQRSLSPRNLSFPFKLISSLLKARKIIKRFKPDMVIGVGGFASGPTLHQATKLGIPTIIQEQNSFPGVTNKLLANKVDKICVAYQNLDKFFPKEKIVFTGNPIRNEVVQIEGKKNEALKFFELSSDKPVVLVVGGSLGARTINEAIEANLNLFKENSIQLIWQTGKNYFTKAEQAVLPFKQNGIVATAFINKMDMAYAAADIVVSRAGAIAISELCVVKKPTILIPSPFVAEDHQTKNAIALEINKAAILVKDSEQKEKLLTEIIRLVNNPEEQQLLVKNIKPLGVQHATDTIMEVVKSILK